MWIRKYIEREWFTFFSSPALLWQTFFLLIPLGALFCFSFLEKKPSGWMLSFSHYHAILTNTYIYAITTSLFFSAITTVCCILIAYPIAYFIAFMISRGRTLLLMLLLMPSWTNIITQIYAWFILLQKCGPLSTLLYKLHITHETVHLLNNKPVIIMGLVYCFLPFMILPIYLSLMSIEKNILEASADLGATNMQTFWRIIIPLSRGGLLNGVLLVAVPAFGEYAAVEILGGANYALWGGNIVNTYLVAGDYSQGAALTIVGISVLLSGIALCITIYKLVVAIASHIATHNQPSKSIEEEGLY